MIRFIARLRKTRAAAFLFGLICTVLLASSASAQNFCDLVTASVIKSTLGLPNKLEAKPMITGGNGCHYIENNKGPIPVIVDTADASGMTGTLFTQRLASLGPNAELIQGLGDAAYYSQKDNIQIAKFPGATYTQQSIVFRTKGRIVSLIVTTAGSGIPRASLQSLANLVASKPLETLIDPEG